MGLTFESKVFGRSGICKPLLSLAVVLVSLVGVGKADDDGPNPPSDDGFYLLEFNVPKVDPAVFDKVDPTGWGALVLTFDGPNGGTGLEGTTFQFLPQCPGQTPGIADDINSDFPKIQMGPGRYRLGPTGKEIDDSETYYGVFQVTVEYEATAFAAPPRVTSAFWQSKPNPASGRTWEFKPGKDLAEPNIPEPIPLPEPSAMAIWVVIGGALFLFRRRKS